MRSIVNCTRGSQAQIGTQGASLWWSGRAESGNFSPWRYEAPKRLRYGGKQEKKNYRDKTRISMKEKYEGAYWKGTLGVSGQAIAGAVRAVGSSVKKVGDYLHMKG